MICAIFLATSAKAEPPAGMVQMCVLCHGAAGEGIESRSGPKIAGLGAAYLADQLTKFKSGWRGTHPNDPYGPQMYVIAQSWKEGDIAAISKHYAEMPEPTPYQSLEGDVAAGKALYETCATCHGKTGEGNSDLKAPRLAYQADWYLLHSLKAYMDGARGYHEDDIDGQGMRAMAQDALSTDDARDLAVYIASLRPAGLGGE